MQVDVAVHGGEAVRMVQAAEYDLVLMDLQMPVLDGLSAARQIRAIAHLHNLPMIAMTAHAMAGDREQSLAAGMNDHVTKPIDPELLFGVLLKWIDPTRLEGRRLPPTAAPPAATEVASEPAPLPAIAGVDWQFALAQVDLQRSRLQKRLRSFLREYWGAPQIVRTALAGGPAEVSYARLQNLAHNLKSGAAYVGAVDLAVQAGEVEQALRDGQHERLGEMGTELIATLDAVLAGLVAVAAGRDLPADDAHRLIGRLEACLRAGDARAEEALFELQTLLAGSEYDSALAAIAQAVDDIEYQAALGPLAELASALDMNQERTHEPG
jgi:two-component system sensor histidine kinase/response regulator